MQGHLVPNRWFIDQSRLINIAWAINKQQKQILEKHKPTIGTITPNECMVWLKGSSIHKGGKISKEEYNNFEN